VEVEVSGQLHTLATLPLGKWPLTPTVQEIGWAPEPVWTQMEREKILPSARNQSLAIQSVN